MQIAITVLIVFITIFHIYIVWIEMFAWNTAGRRTFKNFPKDLFPKTKSMAANQGLYNGFLVAGLIWPFFVSDPEWSNNIKLFFLTCVAVAGMYGGATVQKTIFLLQGVPALIAIGLILLDR